MFAAKQTAIETRFRDADVMPSADQVVFENTPGPSPQQFDEWVRLTVQFGDPKRTQIGGGGYRYFGLVMVQIFLSEGVGVSRGVELADVVSALFRDVQADGICYQVPTVTKMPFSEKGWFQVQVSTPFYFDEVI